MPNYSLGIQPKIAQGGWASRCSVICLAVSAYGAGKFRLDTAVLVQHVMIDGKHWELKLQWVYFRDAEVGLARAKEVNLSLSILVYRSARNNYSRSVEGVPLRVVHLI